MSSVTLSTSPKGNGFQVTITYSNGVSISSVEAFPSELEAISAGALKMLNMPQRLQYFDKPEWND